MNNVKQIVNLLEEEKGKLEDTSIPLKERELLFISLCDNGLLPLGRWLSDWCFTDRDSKHYIENLTDHMRGAVRYQMITECYFDEVYLSVPLDSCPLKTITECIQVCSLSDEKKAMYTERLEALVSSGYCGTVIDW